MKLVSFKTLGMYPVSSLLKTVGAAAVVALAVTAQASDIAAQSTPPAEATTPQFTWDPNDPRIGLRSGWMDAEDASWNMNHLASLGRPDGFFNPETPGDGRFSNTDLAFRHNHLIQGNYNGFQVWDIADPTAPELSLSVVCPGGQGDVSVYGDFVIMSAQETRGRLDCGVEGVPDSVSGERLRGVRIFDLSNMQRPRQVAAIQTCRGSHTHTVVTDPADAEHFYIYVSGTSSVRPSSELEGCSGVRDPEEDPNTSYFRIEVIKVAIADPESAEIVNMPRIFSDEDGNIAGLWRGGDHGEGTQSSRETIQCHDITAYPAIGLAGGACSGNGILLDISDPANPTRIDEVSDPNFAYWHSATFNNDGTKVIFTDEWGGGSAPRCRATDPKTWGANALFRVDENRKMTLAGYYKLPVPQTATENCVAHNGSIVPVPGRDIKVQAWYQGGVSVMDFTDIDNPIEIAFFDRGPLSDDEIFTGGYWSTYWYNGKVYGAEISRGIDVFELQPSEFLSEAELEAANLVQVEQFNAQLQPHIEWPDAVPVAQSYLHQLIRNSGILHARADEVRAVLNQASEGEASAMALGRVAADLDRDAAQVMSGTLGGDAERLGKLAEVLRGLSN